jgi:hypothetical protein
VASHIGLISNPETIMAAMNTSKIVVGGLVTGLVLNVLDFVVNMFIVGERFKPDWDAINPNLWAKMSAPPSMITYVVIDFVLGILLVWTYAAIRPRFGPGAGTAAKASIVLWLFGSALYAGFVVGGLISLNAYCVFGVITLINFLIGGFVGGKLYTEATA